MWQSDMTGAWAITVVNSSVLPRDDFAASRCRADRSVDNLPCGASCKAVASSAGSFVPKPPPGCSRAHLRNASQAALAECTGEADDPHPAKTRNARHGSTLRARMADEYRTNEELRTVHPEADRAGAG